MRANVSVTGESDRTAPSLATELVQLTISSDAGVPLIVVAGAIYMIDRMRASAVPARIEK